ncbi:hypothetical protein GQ44DRAFT_166322 [Phaeosphaeriaceae sp. PMI808]|nr:hypothetical protein GQ44DRAFT_166322 [Phaeosphaeriaceae sp. PMI808]
MHRYLLNSTVVYLLYSSTASRHLPTYRVCCTRKLFSPHSSSPHKCSLISGLLHPTSCLACIVQAWKWYPHVISADSRLSRSQSFFALVLVESEAT